MSTWGRVEGVLHHAGIARFAPIQETFLEDYESVKAVNLDGALYLTKAAWPIMTEQKFGRLTFVTSGGGLVGVPQNTPYAMARTGLLGLMNVARLEGANHNIGVNLLGVAAFTRMVKGMFGSDENAMKTEAW
jgi:NAD(P)-dependent dehydrogenase (short-subunit alcohol dehydrogenase family)